MPYVYLLCYSKYFVQSQNPITGHGNNYRTTVGKHIFGKRN
jgi:hypothetical protein